ncbi:MAG: arginine--tRNA ligase [Elusimicrobiaceae bacterium]
MTLEQLQNEIQKAITAKFGDAFPCAVLQAAPDHVDADFSLSWAMQAAKILKKAPIQIAGEIVPLAEKLPGVAAVSAVMPGFVNIKLSARGYADAVCEVLANPGGCIRKQNLPAKKILFEFVSANPTGPLHVASGRSAALGDSLVRILKAQGYDASSEYYINDAGNQVRLLGESLKARHEGKPLPENGYHGDYLVDIAAKIKDSSGWTAADYSAFAIAELIKTQQDDMVLFRTHFDRWFFETELHKAGAPKAALEQLEKDGKTSKVDGAVWFGEQSDSDKEEDKARVLVRGDGSPTYFLNDIAYHKNKYERGFTELVNILGADHHGYIPRMKKAVEVLGKDPETFKVILHQLVHLNKNGEAVKMSKRAGEFITLRELVDEVGADACRFFFASRTPNSHLHFDIELAKKRSQENPVFYVQYVHARINSIFRALEEKIPGGVPAAGELIKNAGPLPEKLNCSAVLENYSFAPQEEALIRKLMLFPAVLDACVRDLTPHHITTYLMELAGLFHPFYDSCRVINPDDTKTTAARLCLCKAVQDTIRTGLDLIGVSAPESM